MPLGAHVVEDYRRLSLSLKAHPVAFMRARLDARGVRRAEALATLTTGDRVAVAGLVLVRQRPGTAAGVIFMTLEDETGIANLIVWPKAFERLRAIVIGARFVVATGKLQSESGVIHLIVERMQDLTPMLGLLSREGPEADPSGFAEAPPRAAVRRQGDRFAQTQLFYGPRLVAPATPEQRDAARALPAGRSFH
jgi:error-prone DNA polymerase